MAAKRAIRTVDDASAAGTLAAADDCQTI